MGQKHKATKRDEAPRTCAEAVAMSPFKVGDVVQLKSGGQTMTVSCIGPSCIDCLWFDGAGILQDGAFLWDCLRHHDDSIPF